MKRTGLFFELLKRCFSFGPLRKTTQARMILLNTSRIRTLIEHVDDDDFKRFLLTRLL